MPEDLHHVSAVPGGRQKRVALGFAVLLILALLFAAIAVNASNAANARRDAENWLVHTFEVLVAAEGMKAAVNMSIRGERGYLITGDEQFLEPYRKGNADAPVMLARIEALTRDNPAQRAHIARLRTKLADLRSVLDRAIALVRAGQGPKAVAIVRTGVGKHRIDDVLATLDTIETEEKKLLALRSAESARANSAIDLHYYTLASVGFLLLLVAGAVAVSAVRSQRRVREIAEQLRLSATTDELTRLHNRRSFLHLLDVEVARARRSGKPLSVAVADVDFFKRVNDRYGHAGGDAVLRSLARIFEQIMRTGDVVGRLGGEEFAVLMPDTDEIQARIACERLRAAIAGRKIHVPSGEEIGVTLSTGIALLVPGDDRDKLVNRADLALYSAKEGGRNQVRLAA